MACTALLAACATPAPPAPPPPSPSETPRPRGTEPYTIKGRTYVPVPEWKGFEEVGLASWYGAQHQGRLTANGERFDAYQGLTAAHKTLPFDVCVRVENMESGRAVTVRINDRGPFAKDRVIDLSQAAAKEIGLVDSGVARVRIAAVGMADESGRCAGS